MTSADYYDWSQYLGTNLGSSSPGEHFQRLHRELSPSGAHVVIVTQFLESIAGTVELDSLVHTRTMMLVDPVWIKLTVEALHAIGSVGTAAVLRDGLSMPSHWQEKVRRAMGTASLGATIAAARAEMFAAAADKKVETREEIVQLLEAYAENSQGALTSDVAKHGDPRQTSDFDPRRFLAEQRRRICDRQEVLQLRQKLAEMKQRIAEAPTVSPALQKQGQKFLNHYRDCIKRGPLDLIPELQALLGEVEQFRDERPDVFSPAPTTDDALNARLAGIGRYELDLDTQYPTISWEQPSGLECDWTKFQLSFMVSLRETRPTAPGTNAQRLIAAYGSFIDAWERFRPRFRELEPQLKQYVLDFFRTVVVGQLDDEDRAEYEDSSGKITDEAIIRHVRSGGLRFVHEDRTLVGPEIPLKLTGTRNTASKSDLTLAAKLQFGFD